MSFEWFVARRYLTARRKQAFISLISGVSILGVAVGVMALIIALALMTGVQGELRDRIVGATAHIYVSNLSPDGFTNIDAELKRFSSLPGVIGVAPAIVGAAMVTGAGTEASFVKLKGIDPAHERQVADLDKAIRTGSASALSNRPEDAREGIILGDELATTLGVAVGDTVTVLTPEGTLTPFLGPIPKSALLTVVGTFHFGFYEYDSSWALLAMAEAEHLFRKAVPDLIQLRLANMDDAPAMKKKLQTQLGGTYFVQDWAEVNKSLYSALGLEKLAISLTIGLIVMVAALNIVASLVLLVMEKSRDIAILRTMGAPARAIRRIFIYQGLTIGLVGTLSGAALGLLVCFIADRYEVIALPADVYQITYLPFRVHVADVLMVTLGAVAICFLATIYPARQAGRLDPAEALRNQ
jgi:lipoprotein-releasing system permease protein